MLSAISGDLFVDIYGGYANAELNVCASSIAVCYLGEGIGVVATLENLMSVQYGESLSGLG